MNSPAIIQIRNIQHLPHKVGPVLNNICLEAQAGELIGILGAHKTGKTTLLNIIGLLQTPSTGDITFCGDNIKDMDRDMLITLRTLNIGFIEQHFHFSGADSVLELVKQPMLICNFPATLAHNQAQQAITEVGLSLLATQSPQKLNECQLKRAALARVLALKPKLLVADELVSNLDYENASLLLELLKNIIQKRQIACILSGKVEPIYRIADQLYLLKDGSLAPA